MTPTLITVVGNRSLRRYWIGSNRRYDGYNRSLVNRIEDLMAFWSTLKSSGERLAQEAYKMREMYSDGRELYYKLKNQNVDELGTFKRGLRFFLS